MFLPLLLQMVCFAFVGALFSWGVRLQALAIVEQRRSFWGVGFKFVAVALLFFLFSRFRTGLIFSIGAFFGAMLVTLLAVALARKSLLR
jgi:hypothetical protein